MACDISPVAMFHIQIWNLALKMYSFEASGGISACFNVKVSAPAPPLLLADFCFALHLCTVGGVSISQGVGPP